MWIQMFQEAPMKKLKSQKVCKLKDWNFTEKDLYEFFQKLCKKFCSMSIFIKVLSPNSFHFWKTVYICAFLPLKTSCFWLIVYTCQCFNKDFEIWQKIAVRLKEQNIRYKLPFVLDECKFLVFKGIILGKHWISKQWKFQIKSIS